MKVPAPALVFLLLTCFNCTTRKDSMNTTAPQTPTVFSLTNSQGMKADITNYGGKVMTLWVPDRAGNLGDVVLGYDSASQYPTGNLYFGALIGRYGNRIAKGKFSIDGQSYQLATNNGENALHGGPGGFHNVYWQAKPGEDGKSVTLTYLSKDGEEGYPGNLQAKVVYALTDSNELVIEYEATTDKPTVVNLTHHSFFNLAGAGVGDILGHELTIYADKFNPVDAGLIPTGELRDVTGTPFDFREAHAIGERINNEEEQLKLGGGYDHNFVLNRSGDGLSLAARVYEPTSGRVMEVWTTEPGLQFYSGNFLNGNDVGKGGVPYAWRSAFCLEAQHFPDSPNQPTFPNVVLRPGEVYKQRTVYKFSAK